MTPTAVNGTMDPIESGETVKVVWTSEDGSSASVLDEFTVP